MQRWWKLATMAAIVTALLAMAACGSEGSDDSDGPGGGANGSGESNAGDDMAAPNDSGADGAAEEAGDADRGEGGNAVTGTALSSQDSGRKVSFETDIELSSPDVERTYRDITDMARSRGGYVSDAQLRTSNDNEGDQRATVSVRVPADGQDTVLADIRALDGVVVESESTRAREVTEEYTDLESRLRNLERSETRYLELMDAAEGVTEILEVSERLDQVRTEIEQIQGRLNVLDDQVDFATIRANISATGEEQDEEDDGPPSFVEAWTSAWEQIGGAGQAAVAVLAWVSAAAIVVAPVVAIVAGVRFATRRRAHSEA